MDASPALAASIASASINGGTSACELVSPFGVMRTILSKQFTTEKKNSAEKGLKKKKKKEKKKKKKSAQSQHCILVVCTTQQGAGAGEGTIWSWKNTCPTARSQARQNACALRQPRHTFYLQVVFGSQDTGGSSHPGHQHGFE